MTKDNPNMVRYITKLDAGEKGIICAAVREQSRDFKHAHPGMLPFLTIRMVVACLDLKYRNITPYPRLIHNLISKLEAHKWRSPSEEWFNERATQAHMLRKLNDGLVAKRLGIHPERGVPIPGVAAVIKRPRDRKNFERQADAFDNEHPMMTLKWLSDGHWSISCPEKYRHYVEMWLLDFCTR